MHASQEEMIEVHLSFCSENLLIAKDRIWSFKEK